MAVFAVVYVLIFFYAVFVYLKFEWGAEGQDERGGRIAGMSYRIVFPLFPLGWLLLELYNDHVVKMTYEDYKLAIWFLLTGLMILHAIIITILKRKY